MQSMTKVDWMPLDGGTYMGKVTCTSNRLPLRSCHKYLFKFFSFSYGHLACQISTLKFILYCKITISIFFKLCWLSLYVASSSTAERDWSTYSFIHSVKRNRLGLKKAEELVFIHNNWHLLSRKDPGYKKGPEKLWDVLLETSDLDMTVQDISRIALLDVEEDEEHVAAFGASGTSLDSNDEENDIDEDEAIDPSYFDDPFDP